MSGGLAPKGNGQLLPAVDSSLLVLHDEDPTDRAKAARAVAGHADTATEALAFADALGLTHELTALAADRTLTDPTTAREAS